jgi:hypothetical protein
LQTETAYNTYILLLNCNYASLTEEYRIEEERLRAVEHFHIWTPYTTANKLTAVTRIGKVALFPFAAEEADHFLGEVARLLNRIEKESWWTGKLTK